jgi:two-component system, response regulator YesN
LAGGRRIPMKKQIKTIIVDDESRIRRGIERMVRSCGVEWDIIRTFSDGREAYDAITNESLSFDLLISDIRMPEMDGLTLNKELKKQHSFLTIFISGYDDFTYLQTALKDGAVNYILKPIDVEQFQIQLNEVKQKIFINDQEKKEWLKLQEKAAQLDYTKQIQFLSELSWNEEKDISYLDWTRQFPSGTYQLLYVSLDHIYSKTKEFSPEEWNTWIFAVENIIDELLWQKYFEENLNKWWWRGGKFKYWILLNHDAGGKSLAANETVKFSEELRSSIQKFTPFTITVALGNGFTDLSVFSDMKNQLQTLQQFRMIQGGNKIFQSHMMEGITDQKSRGITSSVLKYTEQIINSLERGKREELLISLQSFFREMETLTSPIEINEAVHYLIIRIVHNWIENKGYSDDPDLLTEALKITENAANLIQLKDSIKLWVLKVMGKISLLRGNHQNPIQVAKDWIKSNLHENITIKKIAQQVYMNPNYFCDYFKNQTGETILDYVTTVRLEKAKELLEKTDLKIYDISLLVGYQDTKYFSRLFKQWIGQTPSQFRDQLHHIL